MRAGAQSTILFRPRLCVLLATLGVATVAQASTAQRKLEQARMLYRAGNYSQACPLFEEVTRARPEDGAAWADLGLCELRRGRREASIEASLRAVRHGDERARASAYHNLSLARHHIEVPSAAGSCLELEAPAGLACTRRARLCRHWYYEGGNGGGTHYVGAWVTDADNPEPLPEDPMSAVDGSRPDGTAVLLSASLWISSKGCAPEWSFSHPAFERAVARCRQSSPETVDCEREVRLAMAPEPDAVQPGFPLTDRERKAIREASRQCWRALEAQMEEGSGTWGHIVSVDPCRRRVGVVYDVQTRQRLGPPGEEGQPSPRGKRLQVEESTWEPWKTETP